MCTKGLFWHGCDRLVSEVSVSVDSLLRSLYLPQICFCRLYKILKGVIIKPSNIIITFIKPDRAGHA